MHRGNEKRFVVSDNEQLTEFVELEAAIRKNSIDIVCHWRPGLHPR